MYSGSVDGALLAKTTNGALRSSSAARPASMAASSCAWTDDPNIKARVARRVADKAKGRASFMISCFACRGNLCLYALPSFRLLPSSCHSPEKRYLLSTYFCPKVTRTQQDQKIRSVPSFSRLQASRLFRPRNFRADPSRSIFLGTSRFIHPDPSFSKLL